jgi:hypothetical protein
MNYIDMLLDEWRVDARFPKINDCLRSVLG